MPPLKWEDNANNELNEQRLREKCKSIQLKQQEQHADNNNNSKSNNSNAKTHASMPHSRKVQESVQQQQHDACCKSLSNKSMRTIKIPRRAVVPDNS